MSSLAVAGARGGIATVLAQVFTVLLRTISLIVLAHFVAPHIFGLVAIVAALSAFATTIIFFGVPMASLRVPELSQRARSTLFYFNTSLGFVLGAALFLAAPLIADFYSDPALVGIARWLSLVPLAHAIAIQPRVRLFRDFRFKTVAFAEVVALATGAGFAIALGATGYGVGALIVLQIFPVVVEALIDLMAARWLPGKTGAWKSEVKGILKVGFDIFVTNLVKSGSRQAVIPMAAPAVMPSALGYFDRAQQLTLSPINLTVDGLQRVAVPVLSRLREAPDRMLAYMQRAQLLGAYGTALLYGFLAVLGEPFITILLGSEWRTAGTIVQILAIGATCRALGQSMQWIFIAASATQKGMQLSLWSQPMVAAISIAGVAWGIEGVAWANSVAWIAYWPVATIVAARAAGFPALALFGHVARSLFSFAVPVSLSAGVARLLHVSDVASLALGVLFGALAASALVFLVRPIRQDVREIISTIRSAMGRS